MELILEILSRSGKVESYFKLTKDQTDIGRAYDNDIVLKDQYVCPHHLQVSVVDGQVFATDKQSVNGVKTQKNTPVSDSTPLELGQIFVVGNHLIRVVSSQQEVTSTIKMTILEFLSQRTNRWYWALTAVVMLMVLAVLKRYLGQSTEIIWSTLIVKDLPIPITFFAVGVFVAGAANVFKKEVRFFTCVTFSFVWGAVSMLLSKLNGLLNFNFGDGLVLLVIAKLITFGLAFIATWALFYLTTHFSYKKITLVSFALVFSGQGLFTAYKMADDRVKSYPNHNVHIFPQSYLVNSAEDSKAWVKSSASLYESSAKEAQTRNAKIDK
jgi:hypothetical protein